MVWDYFAAHKANEGRWILKEQAPASFTASRSPSALKWGCLNLLFFQLLRRNPACFEEGKRWLAHARPLVQSSTKALVWSRDQAATESPTARSGGIADTSRSSREKLTPTGLQRCTGKPWCTNSWSDPQRKRTASCRQSVDYARTAGRGRIAISAADGSAQAWEHLTCQEQNLQFKKQLSYITVVSAHTGLKLPAKKESSE